MKKVSAILLFLVFSLMTQSQTVQTIWTTDPVIAKHRKDLDTLLKKLGSSLGRSVYFRVFKQDVSRFGVLEVWIQRSGAADYILAQSFPICYFSGGLGSKIKVGDGKTPEGFYSITAQALNRYSSYHRAFNIGYPNEYDKSRGRTGSLIMIHGNCVSIGCIAMGDDAIEQIWTMGVAALHNGQKRIAVHIFPFRMTAENIALYRDTHNDAFWQMLAPAYMQFEKSRTVPSVKFVDGRYCVSLK